MKILSTFNGCTYSEAANYLISGMLDRYRMTSGWMSSFSHSPSEFSMYEYIPMGYYFAMCYNERMQGHFYGYETGSFPSGDYMDVMIAALYYQEPYMRHWDIGSYANQHAYYIGWQYFIKRGVRSILETFTTPNKPLTGGSPWYLYEHNFEDWWNVFHPRSLKLLKYSS